MRNDLNSLNSGKLAAQACHGANAVQTIIERMFSSKNKREATLKTLWLEWASLRGFGTTIVLETSIKTIEAIHNQCTVGYNDELAWNWEDNRPIIFGSIFDPSYPVSDGSVVHLVPLLTGAYVFGDKDTFDVNSVTSLLKLYP
jgi:hypothetical protein